MEKDKIISLKSTEVCVSNFTGTFEILSRIRQERAFFQGSFFP